MRAASALVSIACAVALCGCQSLAPSNARNWQPNMATLAEAQFAGEQVTLRNVRNCSWITADDYVLDYYDRTYDLTQLENVDFIMVPFQGYPALAHTMLSFGFADGQHVA